MIIDFNTRTEWIEICEALTEEFGFDGDTVAIRAYQGVYHALAELTRGLARQFPTKKEIFYLGKVDPTLEPHAMALAKEGYKLSAISESQLSNPDELIESMGRETLCVLISKSDPVFNLNVGADQFVEKVREKKMFMIEVVHGGQVFGAPPETVERPEAIVHSFGSGKALGFLGARYKFGPIMADGLDWRSEEFLDLSKEYSQTLPSEKIQSLEVNPPKGAKALFSDRDRVLDRACLFWEDIDGSAMVQLLSEKMKLDEEGLLSTLSLSTWGGVTTMNWLEAFSLTPDQVRGSVLISYKLLSKHEGLKAKIEECYEEILQMQSGTD